MGCDISDENKNEKTIKRLKNNKTIIKKITKKGKNGKDYNLIYKEFIEKKSFDFLKDFFYETAMMVNLIHKNLIKIYFISLKNNRIYMEYMDGGDLSDLMEDNSNLPLDFKIHCLLQIADGLNALHEPEKNLNPFGIDYNPIIHSDLKPQNILLKTKFINDSNIEKYPDLKIIDFGVSGIKGKNVFGGTCLYADPELIKKIKSEEDIKFDPKYDIYSYGILMCKLLTGKTPKEISEDIYEPYQIKKEDKCDSKLIEIYKKCISKINERPNIEKIKEELIEFCNNSNNEKLKKVVENNLKQKNENMANSNLNLFSKLCNDCINKISPILNTNINITNETEEVKKIVFAKGTKIETKYIGKYKNNKIDEFGIFIFEKLGIKLISQHNQGIINGYGIIKGLEKTPFEGLIFYGKFKNNFIDDYGYLFYKGFSHEGEYSNGTQNGIGILKQPSGDIYEGEFKNGQFEGIAKYEYNFGQIYEGEFKDYERNGFGIFTYEKNSYYEGNFEKSKFEGYGKFVIDENYEYEGIWKSGFPIGNEKNFKIKN